MEDKILFWEILLWYDPSQQIITCLKLATEWSTRIRYKNFSRLMVKTSVIFIVKCEHTAHFVLITDF